MESSPYSIKLATEIDLNGCYCQSTTQTEEVGRKVVPTPLVAEVLVAVALPFLLGRPSSLVQLQLVEVGGFPNLYISGMTSDAPTTLGCDPSRCEL